MIANKSHVSAGNSIRQFSSKLFLVTALSLTYLDLTSASISAIHNLHKTFPSCDIDGNGFTYTEVLDFARRKRVLTSNACPNHFNMCQDEECSGYDVTRARQNSITFDIPLYPVMAKYQTDTTCVNGTVALALNGVSIESMSCKERKCVAPGFSSESRQSIGDKACDLKGTRDGTWICGDAVQLDATKIDKCGGHVDDRGLYHYHVPPVCLIQQLTELHSQRRSLSSHYDGTVSDVMAHNGALHSVQVGWALDGFPIYGPVGPGGVLMKPCRYLTAMEKDQVSFCLDECNGLYGSFQGIDDFAYRYYMSGEMGSGECSDVVQNGGTCSRVTDKCCISTVPSMTYQPYTIGCFKGCLYGDPSCRGSPLQSLSDTYYPQVSLHPTTVFTGVVEERTNSSSGGEDSGSPEQGGGETVIDYSMLNLMYEGYGRTAIRLPGRKIGIMSRTKGAGPDTPGTNPPVQVDVEELEMSDQDAFITGLTLGYRGSSQATSQLLFTTQKGLWSIFEDGHGSEQFMAGYKSVLIKGYNLGSSAADIKKLTVKGHNCSYMQLINSTNVLCIMSSLEHAAVVEDDDVVLKTVAGNNVGIHLQPLTVARSASKRAVVAEIITTSYRMLPYALAYSPVPVTSTSPAAAEPYVYWSDIYSHRIYRCAASGRGMEVVMTDVKEVYGLVVLDIAASQGVATTSSQPSAVVQPEVGALDQFLFYSDCNRGVVGRVSVSSSGRLAAGPYRGGESYDVISKGSENNHTNVILLKGFTEPRGISAQIERGYFYIVNYAGELYEAELSHFTSTTNTPEFPVDVRKNIPPWFKQLTHAKTYFRSDGLSTLPRATTTSPSTVKPWNEQYIFLPDMTTHSVVVVNDDSFAMSILNLNEGFGSSGVVWPRSLASRRPYEDEMTSPVNNSAVLFVGEFLGKIWRVKLDFTSAHGDKISLAGLKRPELVADYSNFASSVHLRKLINEKKFIDGRSGLVFPELLN